MVSPVSLATNLALWARPASAWTVSENKAEVVEKTVKIEKEAEKHILALSARLKKISSRNHPERVKEVEALRDQAINIAGKVLSSCRTCDNPVMMSVENIYAYLAENAFKKSGAEAFEMLLSMFKEANNMLEANIPDVEGGFDIEGESREKWNQFSETVMIYTNNLIIAEDYERDAERIVMELADKFKKAASKSEESLRDQMLAMSDWLRRDAVIQIRTLFIRYPDRLNYQKSCASLYQYVLAEFGKSMNEQECVAYIRKYSPTIEKYWDTMCADMEREFYQKSGIQLCSLSRATEAEKKMMRFTPDDARLWETNFIRYDPRNVIPIVERALSRYPQVLRARLPKRMLFDFQTNFRGGAISYSEPKFFLLNPEQADCSAHEMFHWFDKVEFTDTFKSSDSLWCNITRSVYEGEWSWLENAKPGYVTGYSLTNSSEDRATVAGMLFESSADQLKSRLLKDPMLLMKVELLTGCHFDYAQGRFVKLYIREELRDCYGLSDYLYYAKWSTENGRVMMDADYWNNILAQNGRGN